MKRASMIQRYKLGDKLIKIDHHPNVDQYGDLLWVDTNASSTSEMIYEFYLHGKDKGLKMSDGAARLIICWYCWGYRTIFISKYK